jgi:hypothetical protein
MYVLNGMSFSVLNHGITDKKILVRFCMLRRSGISESKSPQTHE